jgi:hypothetical protein
MYDYTNRLLYTVTYIYYLILVFLFAVIACANFILRALVMTYPAHKNYVIFMDLLRKLYTYEFTLTKVYIFRCKTRKCGLNAVTSAGPPCTRARGQLSCEMIARFSDFAGKTLNSIHIFFGQARVCLSLLCLCRLLIILRDVWIRSYSDE